MAEKALRVVITSKGMVSSIKSVGPIMNPFLMSVKAIYTELTKKNPHTITYPDGEVISLQSIKKYYDANGEVKNRSAHSLGKAKTESTVEHPTQNNNNNHSKKDKYKKNQDNQEQPTEEVKTEGQ